MSFIKEILKMDLNKELELVFLSLVLYIKANGEIMLLMVKEYCTQEMGSFQNASLIMVVLWDPEKVMASGKILEKLKSFLLMDLFMKECGLTIKEMVLEFKYIQMETNMMGYGQMTKDKVGVNILSVKRIMKKVFQVNLLENFIMIQLKDL